MNLDDRVAIITYALSGIARSVSRELDRASMRLALNGCSDARGYFC